jgi:hypothetical protein
MLFQQLDESIAMYFHIEERRAWIRTQSHTVVFDRDPEFARFVQDPSGCIQRIVRVWAAELTPAHPHKLAYFGAVMLLANQASLSELSRLFRKASEYATCSGDSPKELRRELIETLRKHICQCQA